MANVFTRAWQGIKKLPSRFLEVFRRFPFPVIAMAALTVLAEPLDTDSFTVAALLSALLAAGCGLFIEALGKKSFVSQAVISAVSLAVCAGVYFHLKNMEDVSNATAGMYIAFFVAVIAFDFLALDIKDGSRFEEHLARIVVRAVISGIFATVLFIGLMLVIGGIDLLLADVSSELYEYVFHICYCFFMPVMFLAGVPEKDDEADYPKAIKSLWLYVVTPLVLMFTAVLYIYYIKLLVTRSLPVSQLGGVSLAYIAVATATLLLIGRFEDGFSKKVARILPYTLIVVVGALFFTVIRQIALYGVSITRHLVLAGGITAAVAIVLFIVKKGEARRFVLLAVIIAAIICGIGPLSTVNMTTRSQSARFVRMLEENGLLKDGVITSRDDLSEDTIVEISEITQYAYDYGLKFDYLPPKGEFKSTFGFARKDRWHNEPDDREIYYGAEYGSVIDVSGYDYYIEAPDGDIELPDGRKIFAIENDNVISISLEDDELISIDIEDAARQIFEKYGDDDRSYGYEDLAVTYENEKAAAKLIFDYLQVDNDGYYMYGSEYLLIKIK